ncbi:putative viral a-type inclusion protein repeat domain-containing protein [Zalerion maritima]|uniref:Viral a-type inclusion protein repeat domain-containing protein n=1 Tax=Zalerion maritima TaxID=339359 RepID=A0AAD5RVN4_9PEZI|nr:putative viral a-type inclusion protein repeat domain-containing protein [Zalerion maritima]
MSDAEGFEVVQHDEAPQSSPPPAATASKESTPAPEADHPTPKKTAGTSTASKPATKTATTTGMRRPIPSSTTGTKTAAGTTRTTGGMAKAPTRAPIGSTLKRTTTASSTASHRSQPSVSEDEKKRTVASTVASRRTSAAPGMTSSSVHSSPGKPPATKSTASTVRRPAASSTTTTRTTPGTSTATRTTAGTTARTSTGARPGGVVADAKKRLSTVGVSGTPASTAARHTSRPSLHSTTASAASHKEVEELKAKLSTGEAEAQSFKTQIESLEAKVADLNGRIEKESDGAHAVEDGLKKEHDELVESLNKQHEDAVAALKAQVSEVQEQLQTTKDALEAQENEVKELRASKDAVETQLAEIKTSMETLESGYQSKLQDSESSLAKASEDYSTKIEELRKSLEEQHSAAILAMESKYAEESDATKAASTEQEKAVAEMKTSYESAVAELEAKIDELTKSQTSLEEAHKAKIGDEEAAHSVKIAALEAEVVELRNKFEETEKTAKTSESELSEKASELEAASDRAKELEDKVAALQEQVSKLAEDSASLQKNLDELNADNAKKEAALAKLQEEHKEANDKHQKSLETITKDYEDEIESLKGDAFFKRKFLDLEAKHEELTKSHEEAVATHEKTLEDVKKEHAKSLVSVGEAETTQKAEIAQLSESFDALKEQHEAAVAVLAEKETSHQQALDALRASLAMEFEGAKAKSTEEYTSELNLLKTQHAQEVEEAKADSGSTYDAQIKELQEGHNSVLKALKEDGETELEKRDAAHAVELGAFKNQLSTAEEKLEKVLKEHEAQLQSTKEEQAAEVEKLVTQNMETVESLKNDSSVAQFKIQELEALHAQAMADIQEEHEVKLASYSADAASSKELEQTLEETKSVLSKAEDENKALSKQLGELKTRTENDIDDLTQQLAQEKMDKTMALAELETAKNAKPDTTELDALKAEFAGQKDALAKTASELEDAKSDLEMSRKELESQKLGADAAAKTAQADYNEMHDTMTRLVEEVQTNLQSEEGKSGELQAKIADFQSQIEELQAKLKAAEGRATELEKKKSEADEDLDVKMACDQRMIEQLEEKLRIAEELAHSSENAVKKLQDDNAEGRRKGYFVEGLAHTFADDYILQQLETAMMHLQDLKAEDRRISAINQDIIRQCREALGNPRERARDIAREERERAAKGPRLPLGLEDSEGRNEESNTRFEGGDVGNHTIYPSLDTSRESAIHSSTNAREEPSTSSVDRGAEPVSEIQTPGNDAVTRGLSTERLDQEKRVALGMSAAATAAAVNEPTLVVSQDISSPQDLNHPSGHQSSHGWSDSNSSRTLSIHTPSSSSDDENVRPHGGTIQSKRPFVFPTNFGCRLRTYGPARTSGPVALAKTLRHLNHRSVNHAVVASVSPIWTEALTRGARDTLDANIDFFASGLGYFTTKRQWLDLRRRRFDRIDTETSRRLRGDVACSSCCGAVVGTNMSGLGSPCLCCASSGGPLPLVRPKIQYFDSEHQKLIKGRLNEDDELLSLWEQCFQVSSWKSHLEERIHATLRILLVRFVGDIFDDPMMAGRTINANWEGLGYLYAFSWGGDPHAIPSHQTEHTLWHLLRGLESKLLYSTSAAAVKTITGGDEVSKEGRHARLDRISAVMAREMRTSAAPKNVWKQFRGIGESFHFCNDKFSDTISPQIGALALHCRKNRPYDNRKLAALFQELQDRLLPAKNLLSDAVGLRTASQVEKRALDPISNLLGGQPATTGFKDLKFPPSACCRFDTMDVATIMNYLDWSSSLVYCEFSISRILAENDRAGLFLDLEGIQRFPSAWFAFLALSLEAYTLERILWLGSRSGEDGETITIARRQYGRIRDIADDIVRIEDVRGDDSQRFDTTMMRLTALLIRARINKTIGTEAASDTNDTAGKKLDLDAEATPDGNLPPSTETTNRAEIRLAMEVTHKMMPILLEFAEKMKAEGTDLATGTQELDARRETDDDVSDKGLAIEALKIFGAAQREAKPIPQLEFCHLGPFHGFIEETRRKKMPLLIDAGGKGKGKAKAELNGDPVELPKGNEETWRFLEDCKEVFDGMGKRLKELQQEEREKADAKMKKTWKGKGKQKSSEYLIEGE